jgi:hypothetical protein
MQWQISERARSAWNRFSVICQWRYASWLAVCVFWGIGLWWFPCSHLPNVGKGGILLAVGATLMPVFWERVGIVAKMPWIAMLFLLLGVEYRAIDKDKRDSTDYLTSNFNKILDKENTNLENVLDQEHKNLQDILDSQQSDFTRMLGQILQQERQQAQEFNTVLAKEQRLFERQQEVSEFLTDKLIPASDPTPANTCHDAYPDDVFVFFGSNGNASFTDKFPHTILQVRGRKIISIDRTENNSLTLSVDIRDSSNRIIARLNREGFAVSHNYDWYLLRPDESTVVVEDEYGNDVVRARFLNPRAFSVSGRYYDQGNVHPLDLNGFSRSCFGHNPVDIIID